MGDDLTYESVVVTAAKNGYAVRKNGPLGPISKHTVFESFESLVEWLKVNFQHNGTDADSITQE